jgi:hypothetical protein
MSKHFSLKRPIAALALAGAATSMLAFVIPAQAARHVKAVETATAGEVVTYKDLERYVGAVIVVDTTFGTTHRGTLIHYTNPALTMRLGPEKGSIELTVPEETVRRATVVEPATPAAPDQGGGSAKKN